MVLPISLILFGKRHLGSLSNIPHHPSPEFKIHQLKDLLEEEEGLPVPLDICHLYHHVCLVHDVREGKLERQVQETYNFTFIPSNLSNLCQVLSASPLCFCK